MSNLFKRFFVSEETEEDSDISECHQILAFAREPYFDRFMAYIDKEGDRPLEVGDQISMIRSASRINTFKEIKSHLKRQIQEAAEIIQREMPNE